MDGGVGGGWVGGGGEGYAAFDFAENPLETLGLFRIRIGNIIVVFNVCKCKNGQRKPHQGRAGEIAPFSYD